MLSSANPERYLFVKATLLMEWENNAETNYKTNYKKKTWGNWEFEKLIRALLQRFPLRQ